MSPPKSTAVATVETVRGPVPLDRLGRALMHEHIFIVDAQAHENYAHLWGDDYWDETSRVKAAADKLKVLRESGVETLVDATAMGLGRNVARIQRVNAAVDLNIIVATGVYAFLELPGFLAYRSDDWIAELFVREIREGIGGTGVKAGFIKCCVEHHGLAGDVPRILGAVSAAAVETGAPVMVHTNAAARTGIVALEFLSRAGVDPRRIVIAHAGDSNDLEYLHRIADSGASLGCDRFGAEHFNPDRDRVRTLAALVAGGLVDHVHLGHDTSTFNDFMVGNPRFAGRRLDYQRISERIVPALIEAGVSQDDIDRMLIGNPRRFFAPLQEPVASG